MIARRSVLAPLELSVPLWLPAALGMFWGGAWILLAWGLWRLKIWSRWLVPIAAAIYEAGSLLQQVVLAREPYTRGRLTFAAAVAVATWGIVVLILNTPSVRRAFASSGSAGHIVRD